MQKNFIVFILACGLLSHSFVQGGQEMRFRPPAVHLVVHGPYFRVWSMSDRLNDDRTKHWTGKSQVFVTMLQVDGKAYWIMGREPRSIPALPLVSYEVVPKRPVVGGVLIKMLADPALVKMWRRH